MEQPLERTALLYYYNQVMEHIYPLSFRGRHCAAFFLFMQWVLSRNHFRSDVAE